MRRLPFVLLGLAITMALVCLLSPCKGRCANLPASLGPAQVRPGAESGPTKVSIGVWLTDVLGIDSASDGFRANFVVGARWRDPRLVHNQPGVMRYNLEDIWHPDLIVVNATGTVSRSLPQIVEVAGDGTVTYRQRIGGSFAQPLDLRSFPFDHATFRIQAICVDQAPTEIHFVPSELMVAAGYPDGVGIAKKLTLQDWRVTGFTANALPYEIAPGVEYAGYAFEFRAERLKQHYVIKVIIPLLLIVMMSWLVFWIDPSMGGEQISVAITSMLTLIAYRFAVGSEVPRLPYLTDLDAFILVSSMLVFLALVEVVITSMLYFKERKHLARAIDRQCRWIFPIVFIGLTATILLT